MKDDFTKQMTKELLRIEEDCEHSAKRHFNASNRWENYHLLLGIPSAVIAAIAGASAFNNYPILAGVLAITSTALTTVLTFLKPSERSEKHQAIGNQYLSLRNKTRLFRELDLKNEEESKNMILELSATRDDLNSSALNTTRKDYELAKQDIDEGRAKYKVDKYDS